MMRLSELDDTAIYIIEAENAEMMSRHAKDDRTSVFYFWHSLHSETSAEVDRRLMSDSTDID